MTRRHDAHFTALHVAQEARRDHANLDFADVPIQQPAERSSGANGESSSVRSPSGQAWAKQQRTQLHRDSRESPAPISKYRNVRTGAYASRREAKRAAELQLLEKAGAIRNLREQVPILLLPAQDGERPVWYVCDFQYEEEPREPNQTGWQQVTEDVKGLRTREYILKRKLLLFIHRIRIRET